MVPSSFGHTFLLAVTILSDISGSFKDSSQIEQYFESTVVPRYWELQTSAQTNKYPTMKHFLLRSGVVTHTNSSKCNKFRASAEC